MLLLGSDPLARFLRSASERYFVWGQFDCLMWLADWIKASRGVDPGDGWRGSYSSALGAARIIKEQGGMVSHVDARLAPFGIRRTDTPRRGDIAVVRASEGEMGAIVHGGTVSCLTERGVIVRRVADTPILAAWRV